MQKVGRKSRELAPSPLVIVRRIGIGSKDQRHACEITKSRHQPRCLRLDASTRSPASFRSSSTSATVAPPRLFCNRGGTAHSRFPISLHDRRILSRLRPTYSGCLDPGLPAMLRPLATTAPCHHLLRLVRDRAAQFQHRRGEIEARLSHAAAKSPPRHVFRTRRERRLGKGLEWQGQRRVQGPPQRTRTRRVPCEQSDTLTSEALDRTLPHPMLTLSPRPETALDTRRHDRRSRPRHRPRPAHDHHGDARRARRRTIRRRHEPDPRPQQGCVTPNSTSSRMHTEN